MKLLPPVLVVAIGLGLCAGVSAQQNGKKGKKRKRKKKPNPALKPIEDVPGLPRVLLIGDSISIGYTIPTRKLLEGKVNVHRIPTNGGHTAKGLQQIDAWLGEGKWDVIHFNWGLHDLKFLEGKQQVPVEQYETNLNELVARMKKTGAKLIWCSTTPVPGPAPDGTTVQPLRKDSDVVAYNEAARRIMDANGVAIDDVYAFALPRLKEIQRPMNVHFSPEGSADLAGQVADSILKALGQPPLEKAE